MAKAPNEFRAGDIIVMAVARHYSIGRITSDGGTQEHVASETNRAAAVALACQLAGATHRVFLYKSAGSSTFAPCDCRQIYPPTHKSRS